jgi:hypothetical protein
MRRATIRRDPATKTWTVQRPAYGFSPHDEVKHGFRTQRAALRWTDRTLRPHGSPITYLQPTFDADLDAYCRSTQRHTHHL